MEKHMQLLGLKVRDIITGFEGVVTSISFDLYGCVQAIVNQPVGKDKTLTVEANAGRWFDTKRLKVLNSKPVMEVPTFAVVPGGQTLPSPRSRY